MVRHGLCALAGFVASWGGPLAAWAQTCTPQWSNPFPAAGIDGVVHALAVFDDDATGPRLPSLFAGGAFANAGGVAAARIARWTGSTWEPLGGGLTSTVFSMAVYDDDDTGPHLPALYVAGNFEWAGVLQVNRIAKWNGTLWSALSTGLNGVAYTLIVWDADGSGPGLPALYVGGLFSAAGGTGAANIAKWNGTAWSALGAGTSSFVSALATFDDDGAGPHATALYAGGGFTMAGSVQANRVAKWDGTTWSRLQVGADNGVNDVVNQMVVYDDDGSGPNAAALYLGGMFTTACGVTVNRVAKWNGAAFSAVGGGADSTVTAMAVFDYDGSGTAGSALYIGGDFTSPASRVAKWNGSAWSGLGTGTNGNVRTLVEFDDDGAGPDVNSLYLGGDFGTAGGLSVGRLARWGCPPSGSTPTITQQPQSQTGCAGGSVTFTVVATGAGTLTYQWRKAQVDIQGADQSSYTINPVTLNDAGSYDVVVSNASGSVTSDPATLTVNTPPAVTQHPQSQTVCVGGSAAFAVVASGTAPLSYQWRKDGENIDGATDSSYGIATVALGDAGNYDCVVLNGCGTQVSNAATLTVITKGPTIVVQPQGQTVCVGDPVTFSVTAEGPPPYSYQWRKGGEDIGGATGATYEIAAASVGDAGTYDCVVSNPCGSVTSDPATLTVNVCVTRGDMNCDGAVNNLDIDHFVQALFYPEQYIADHDGDPWPSCNILNGDMNRDGEVNNLDINGFVDCLFYGNC